MILGFKTQFPWGEPTYFVEKITMQPGFWPKIHTLRDGERWKPGQSIQHATGVRTKQYNQFHSGTCISTQNVIIANVEGLGIPVVYVDGRRLSHSEKLKFAMNDGFDTLADFARWFNKEVYVLQLIHWTNFKY